jgi:hypothetical protein
MVTKNKGKQGKTFEKDFEDSKKKQTFIFYV